MSQNKKSFFLAGGVLVATLLLFFLYTESNVSNKPWSMVYLSTGKVYIGKISSFPRLQLYNAYALEKRPDPQDPSKETNQLVPVSEAVWAPKTLYLNRDQIIFSGPLKEGSAAWDAVEGKR